MAPTPENLPQFDFGPERTYSAEAIAEQVIWPLVDSLWRGDFRQESLEGYDFRTQKRGKALGRILDVDLYAGCEKDEEDTIRSATLYVEEVVTGAGRSVVLEAARKAANEWPEGDEYDEEAYPAWPEGDEDEFVVKKGFMYDFDTEGDWYIEPYRSVAGPHQHLNVPVNEAEAAEVDSENRLWLPDIENIEAGCLVLSAPKAIVRAIKAIKARPVLVY